MSSMKFALEGESSEDEKKDFNKLEVNETFAKNYDTRRRKEEYQKLKDKYGDLDSESDESASDNELAGTDCPEFDMDFFRVVAALELKHPILNEDRKFFKENYEFKSENMVGEEEKPLTLKDYERKIILEKGGVYDDEQMPSTSYDESNLVFNGKEMKVGCGFDDDNVSDDDDEETNKISVAGLFTKKERAVTDVAVDERQSNDAISFLKGKKKSLGNKLDDELFGGLKKVWKEKMSNEDKFLMDYFVNERYLEEEDDAINRSPHHFAFDPESMSDDEKTYNIMEEFESKYRFRFEEPDEEYIKSHPRIINDSLRTNSDKRKEIRNRRKMRYEEQEEKKAQEISRMKAYKRKEILERIEKLKEIAGHQDLNFEEIDLDADFDPEKHDEVMGQMFNDEYYHDGQDERDKPSIEDEELKRELEEEYTKLENLDSMTEGAYRYENVEPNNFGLSTEEILMAKDTELNRWYSLKKMLRHERSKELELRELKNYCHRASMVDVKKKILPSLFSDNVEDVWAAEEERKRKKNIKKKERKLRKKEAEELSTMNAQSYETNEKPEAEAEAKKRSKEKGTLKEKAVESANVANDSQQTKLERKKKKKKDVNNEGKNAEMEKVENIEICKKKKRIRDDRESAEVLIEPEAYDQIERDETKKIKKLKLDDETSQNLINGAETSKSLGKKGSNRRHKSYLEETIEITATPTSSEPDITTEETPNDDSRSSNSAKKRKNKSLISGNISQKDQIFISNNNYNDNNKQSNKLCKKKKRSGGSSEQLPVINEKESELNGITDARLAAYGANPKKLRKKLKYSNQ